MVNKRKALESLKRPLNNQRGAVLVFSLIILVVLTLMGVFSVQIANNEITTAGNNESHITLFYMLEGVGIHGAAHLESRNSVGDDNCENPTDPTLNDCPVYFLYNVDKMPTFSWLDETFTDDPVGNPNVYDLAITDRNIFPDATVFPQIAPYPTNWNGSLSNNIQRVEPVLQKNATTAIEPRGYADGTDLIRFAVQDSGPADIYSTETGEAEVRAYDLYGLYEVNRGSGKTYPGRRLVELGYRMELEEMEVL